MLIIEGKIGHCQYILGLSQLTCRAVCRKLELEQETQTRTERIQDIVHCFYFTWHTFGIIVRQQQACISTRYCTRVWPRCLCPEPVNLTEITTRSSIQMHLRRTGSTETDSSTTKSKSSLLPFVGICLFIINEWHPFWWIVAELWIEFKVMDQLIGLASAGVTAHES